ncbi:hypothetical protein BGW39_003128 [Mortierella sp. 14UC]|nr:hypothetical protein BGW39_003128 [Mortierella sp. 14UC]
MAGKPSSELDRHVPESDAKSQMTTTVGEPTSLPSEATLPSALGAAGHSTKEDGTSAAEDETKEIETTTARSITPDNTSSFLTSDDSSEVSQDGLLAAPAHNNDDNQDDDDSHSEKEVIDSEPISAGLSSSKRISSYVFPSASTGSMKQHQLLERESSRKEGKEGKGSFLLHRIGVRKNSFTESAPPSSATLSPMDGASDTSSIRSQSTQRSVGSGSTQQQHQKLSKRSTKLLGKFVPKFLHTSFSPSLSTPGNTSPRLQTVGLSPLSARSSRSGSISGQSGQSNQSPVSKTGDMFSADTAGAATLPGSSEPSSNKSPRESLALDLTNHHSQYDKNSLSPGFTHIDATSPQYLEFLRSDSHISPSLMARRSSCSSATSSKMSGNSLGSKLSSSVSSFDPSESNGFRRHSSSAAKGGDGMFAFEVEYEEGDVEEDQEVEDAATGAIEVDEAAANNDEENDPPLSPYIIDEDCDDDFFLNSVLRKKSIPSLTTDYNDHHQGQGGNHYSIMMNSCPSSTTMSSIHSSATTPSLSGWSSSSSQASTPSPTSPLLLNGQVYPFPVTSASPPTSANTASSFGAGLKSSSSGGVHLHYRSNPLPPPIKLGLDEKRSRLREAVGEWRRSAYVSN